ncbi:MAG TPA: 4-alpha-glucanotransferase [Euzebyales bacterium]
MSAPPPTRPGTTLRRLARAVGVADAYDASGRTHHAPDATLRAALRELGHPCDTDGDAARSLRAVRRAAWTRPVDPVAVCWRDATGTSARTRVSVSAGSRATVRLTLEVENGGRVPVAPPVWGGVADTTAGPRRRGAVTLPQDLPLGYHHLTVDDRQATAVCTVIVAPGSAPAVTARRRWGWMLQAYAVRSAGSWGQGEFRDIGMLADWAAPHGADFLLINPVHATEPTLPQQPSPYSPTSRRFVNPCYLHVPDVDGFTQLAASDPRWEHAALPGSLRPDTDRIDRDAVWATKRAALWQLYTRGPADDADARARLAAFRDAGGTALQRFAVFCALAEEHGGSFEDWPADLRDPRSEAVAAWAGSHADLVAFHAWLQQLCTDQLDAMQARAHLAGMDIGVIGDLAVGVAPGGADVWALPDEFARTMRVGAPPDAFNRQGQDWDQPPPLPNVMRDTGHRTMREVLAAAFAGSGGLRIDHILGFSRLFWIPEGGSPADGTYVRYPAEELFAVLTLEARRAGAVVIGEDLGTVDDRIRRLMRERGVAGSAVLWFEVDECTPHGRRRPRDYPRAALASVTTHDLPTATGWWDGSSLEIRDELDLLGRPLSEERAERAREHASMLALLEEAGIAVDDAGVRERVVAMHRLLAETPTALVAVALWDGVGDPRQPNLPGTVDAYPNWRLPLAEPGPDGLRPITVERLRSSPAIAEVAATVHTARR